MKPISTPKAEPAPASSEQQPAAISEEPATSETMRIRALDGEAYGGADEREIVHKMWQSCENGYGGGGDPNVYSYMVGVAKRVGMLNRGVRIRCQLESEFVADLITHGIVKVVPVGSPDRIRQEWPSDMIADLD